MKALEIFLMFVLSLSPSVGAAAALLLWPGTKLGQGLFVAAKLFLVFIPLIHFLFLEKDKLGSRPPFPLRGMLAAGLIGLGLGSMASVVFYSLVQGELIGVELLLATAAKSGLDQLQVYLGLSLYWIFLNSLIEEIVWRWFLYRNLKKYFSLNSAMIVSSLAFTPHHTVALSAQFHWLWALLMSVGVFIAGCVFAAIYERRQSLAPAYFCHLILDIPIFVFGYWLIFLRQ